MSMVSRAGLVAVALLVLCGLVAAGAAGVTATGTATYVVRHDPRLCPSHSAAAGSRSRRAGCVDDLRHPRCYVADAVHANGEPAGTIAEEALVRGAMSVGRDDLGALVVSAVYEPAGRAAPRGGYYRVTDAGIRCVRAPCFSYRVAQVNGVTRTMVSSLDLGAARATPQEVARTLAAVQTKNGLYARGRFAPTPDGGRVSALRLCLRTTPPRA